jgi:hypothetical protein
MPRPECGAARHTVNLCSLAVRVQRFAWQRRFRPDALDYFQACPPRRDRLYYRNAMRGISISSGFRMEKFRGSAKAVQRGAVIGRLRALALVGLGVSLL